MPMSADVDKDFAMVMKHHHQKKEMADLDRWMQSKGAAGGTAKQSDSAGLDDTDENDYRPPGTQ